MTDDTLKLKVTLTESMRDPAFFGTVFNKPSFWPWFVISKLIDGIPLTERPRDRAVRAMHRPPL